MTSTTERGPQWAARQDEQATAFDRIGDRYDEAFPHKDGQYHTIERFLAHLPAGAEVLDVGCGTGLPAARRLTDRGCRVTGIDISPVMVELSSRNVPEARFLQRDVCDLDAHFGTFDGIVAFFSLLMLPRSTIVEVLGTLRSMLRPQGCLALAMVDADMDDLTITFLEHPVRVSGWPLNRLQEVLVGAGFDILSQSIRSYTPATEGTPPEIQVYLLATPSGAIPD